MTAAAQASAVGLTVAAQASAATSIAAAQAKAASLVEALPWLERFRGQIVVVKLGGNAMTDEALRVTFAQDVVFLRYAGLRPVVVHGGGPQISAQMDKLGMPTTFRAGLRVTTPEAMNVVRMVLTGQVNREVVGLINQHGPFAVGMSGEDAHLLTARRAQATVDGELVDLGQVGQIESVNPGAVAALLADGRIPVISSVARGQAGEIYNVNADTAAAAIAVALGAAKLVVLTDVPGLYADWPGSRPADSVACDPGLDGAGRGSTGLDGAGLDGAGRGSAGLDGAGLDGAGLDGAGLDGAGLDGAGLDGGGLDGGGLDGAGRGSTGAASGPGEVISRLSAAELAAMLPGLSDGMIPKMEACLTAVTGGVPQAHVLDGRLPHAVLLEIFTDTGVGTMVVPDGAVPDGAMLS